MKIPPSPTDQRPFSRASRDRPITASMKHFFKIVGRANPKAVLVAWCGDSQRKTIADADMPEGQGQTIPGVFQGVEPDSLHDAVSEHFVATAISDMSVRLVVSVDTATGDCRVWRHAA